MQKCKFCTFYQNGTSVSVKKYLFEGYKNNLYLRDPSLAGLHGEQCEHGHEAIVVMEVLTIPFPNMNNRRQVGFNVLKVHSPEIALLAFGMVANI